MRARTKSLVLLGAVVVAGRLPAIASLAPTEATHFSKVRRDGVRITVSTGTGGGTCRAEGKEIVCEEGSSFASADLDGGCGPKAGEGYCLVELDGELAFTPGESGDAEVVFVLESRVDVRCGTGGLEGVVFSFADGDGQGHCAAERDPARRISGARCTKNGQECAAMNCEDGCTSTRSMCRCEMNQPARGAMKAD